ELGRKGTGFLRKEDVADLVDEEEEEEEDEPGSPEAGRRKVGFEKPAEEAQTEREGKPVARKGTGFVNVGDLPSDDEEDGARKHVVFDPSTQARKQPAVDIVCCRGRRS
ncbi:unnamed protein product, partial [Symbiodinium sp. KB8]